MTNIQETVNTILIDVLKGVKETGSELYAAGKAGVVQAVDFALQQAPLVVQEFLSWKMGEAIFNCIFYSIGVIILLGIIIWTYKKIKKDAYSDAMAAYIPITVFSVVFTIFLMMSIKTNVETIIKIKLAPRVYIIEYVTGKK